MICVTIVLYKHTIFLLPASYFMVTYYEISKYVPFFLAPWNLCQRKAPLFGNFESTIMMLLLNCKVQFPTNETSTQFHLHQVRFNYSFQGNHRLIMSIWFVNHVIFLTGSKLSYFVYVAKCQHYSWMLDPSWTVFLPSFHELFLW